jgi:hypothetical protein
MHFAMKAASKDRFAKIQQIVNMTHKVHVYYADTGKVLHLKLELNNRKPVLYDNFSLIDNLNYLGAWPGTPDLLVSLLLIEFGVPNSV